MGKTKTSSTKAAGPVTKDDCPFFYNKPFRLSAEEKALFLSCADKATSSLKRNQKRAWLFGWWERGPHFPAPRP